MIWQGKTDEWYFSVQPDPQEGLGNLISPDDVVSLTIEEEIQLMPQGSLLMRDPHHVYSRIFKTGMFLDVAWGWVHPAIGQAFPDVSTLAPAIDRTGMRVMILSPSGDGQDDGDVTFGCNFMAVDFRGAQQARWWRNGTKADVIRQVLNEIGVANPDIDFLAGTDAVTSATAVGQQFLSDFQFLVAQALAWDAIFLVGHDRQGNARAAFVDPWKVSTCQTVKDISGSRDGIVRLSYKTSDQPNVLRYHWQDHSGDSGTGDSVTPVLVNGQITFIHRVVGTDTVETWSLNMDRVQAAFAEDQAKNPQENWNTWWAAFQEGMSATKLEQLRKYFDVTQSKTAPQGFGYTITGTMLGNTAMTPGVQPVFGEGFPDMISSADVTVDVYGNLLPKPPSVGARPTRFYCQKATHKLDMSGYLTDFEVVDAYVLSNIGQPIIPNLFGLPGA